MNKIIITMMLAFACVHARVCAQDYIGNTPETRTEQIFGSKADYLNHKFIIHLTNENRVTVQLSSMKDLPAVINLDSLFTDVLINLEPLKDSLQNELNTKRIDYIIDTNGSKKIRIINFPTAGSTYAVRGGDIALLKIEQDTLRVKGFMKSFAKSYTFFPYKLLREQKYWEVTFLVNNILDIAPYLNGTLTNTMKKISDEYISKTKWTRNKDKNFNFTANYYPYDKEKPGKSAYTGTRPAILLIASIRFGLETVRNSFGSSFSEGISVNIKKGNIVKLYTAYLELLLLPDRDNMGKWQANSYEFITLQWSSIKPKTILPVNKYNKLTYENTASVSYLMKGNGNYFEENTFKFGFPGLRYKMLYLYPQLVWNKYPSISFKLTLE